MQFNKVEISNFRNLRSTTIIPSPSLNVISGSNGSGKSSLLEALYYLGSGTSFRTHRLSNIVSHNERCFTLFCEASSLTASHRIGLQRCRDLNHQTRIDGRDIARRSELVQLSPLQVLSPESIQLLAEGSEHRRNFIDWALFHVEHTFHYHLSHYLRALKQRNALLKRGDVGDILFWDSLLIEHGLVIDGLRMAYTKQLISPLSKYIESLLPGLELDIRYRSGWNSELTLSEALIQSRESDTKLKYTTVGPHRGDLLVRAAGGKVSEVLSRGQLKLVVIALKLAQLSLLYSTAEQTNPVILVDDLAAELDIEHRALLLDTIRPLSSQLFITTPDISLIDYRNWRDRKVFHVEHGEVKEVV